MSTDTSTASTTPSATLRIAPYLQAVVVNGGSDLHLKVGSPPKIRISGSLVPLQVDPLTAASAKNNDFLRPYRGYGDINVVTWSGTSNYNSMQVQLNRRYTQGLQFGAAYTYSKSFDYANDDTSDLSAPRPYKAFNYAPSDFDQTHIATFYHIYDVPGLGRRMNNKFVGAVLDNWQISGTTSYVSGKPKNLTVSYTSGTATISSGQTCPPGTFQTSATQCTMITDFTGGTVNARPNVLCDPMKNVAGADPTGTPFVINTSCFAAPTALWQIGNLPRNAVRMPSIFNTDFAFFKNIRLGEDRGIQLRWEAFNLFNRANFAPPSLIVFTGAADNEQPLSTFGRIRSTTTSARQVQLGVRLTF